MDIIRSFLYAFVLILIVLIPVKGIQEEPLSNSPIKPAKEDPVLGPQSTQSIGGQSVLVVAVRFPDVQPRLSLQQIRIRAVDHLNQYVREQSYGSTWIEADFMGWVDLPSPISNYKLSPSAYEIIHERERARTLIEDTMTAVENKVNFNNYQHLFIIPGAHSRSEKGYGPACYCANPGLLSRQGKGYHEYALLKSKGGESFRGGIFVGLEIAHLGMYAHDFFHALGGIHNRCRLVP